MEAREDGLREAGGGAAAVAGEAAPRMAAEGAGEGEPEAVEVDCYVLFPGHTDGMMLFEELKREGVGARIAPTPRAARAACGMSLLVSCDDAERIEAAAAACGAAVECVARLPRRRRADRDRYC